MGTDLPLLYQTDVQQLFPHILKTEPINMVLFSNQVTIDAETLCQPR